MFCIQQSHVLGERLSSHKYYNQFHFGVLSSMCRVLWSLLCFACSSYMYQRKDLVVTSITISTALESSAVCVEYYGHYVGVLTITHFQYELSGCLELPSPFKCVFRRGVYTQCCQGVYCMISSVHLIHYNTNMFACISYAEYRKLVRTLIKNLEAQLVCIDNQINVLNFEAVQESLQWEAYSQVVLQFEASLTKLGHEFKQDARAEEIAAACSQRPLAPILKMYYSNVTKLGAYAAAKSLSKTVLSKAHAAERTSTSCLQCLAALQGYLGELCARKDGVLLRPRPLCNIDEEVLVQKHVALLPFVLECCICCQGFPFMDVVLCVYQHVYHLQCATHLFKSNVTCAVPMCGLIPQTWYNSFGFGEYDKIAIIRSCRQY